MLKRELSQVIKHWGYIAPFVSYPRNDTQFKKLVNTLDELLAITGEDENHSLMDLVDIISYFIESYENNRYSSEQKKSTGLDALKFLMEAHHLTQNDFSDIGSQGVVSEILHGKRLLNLRQIVVLSKRFGVSPATFIDTSG
jgi:HTH-type transcriptional regulator / antitoxin HigA